MCGKVEKKDEIILTLDLELQRLLEDLQRRRPNDPEYGNVLHRIGQLIDVKSSFMETVQDNKSGIQKWFESISATDVLKCACVIGGLVLVMRFEATGEILGGASGSIVTRMIGLKL